MPGFKNTLVRTTGNLNMAALGKQHYARLIHMIVPQQPDFEGLNAKSYNPYKTAGGTSWKEKMSRHSGTAIKNVIVKQRWDELVGQSVACSVIKLLKRTRKPTGSTPRSTHRNLLDASQLRNYILREQNCQI